MQGEGGGEAAAGARNRLNPANRALACYVLCPVGEQASKRERNKPAVPGYAVYVKYMDELARDLGVVPPSFVSLDSVLNPAQALRLLLGPMGPNQYRITQPPGESRTGGIIAPIGTVARAHL